jgi:hypothetical protein
MQNKTELLLCQEVEEGLPVDKSVVSDYSMYISRVPVCLPMFCCLLRVQMFGIWHLDQVVLFPRTSMS